MIKCRNGSRLVGNMCRQAVFLALRRHPLVTKSLGKLLLLSAFTRCRFRGVRNSALRRVLLMCVLNHCLVWYGMVVSKAFNVTSPTGLLSPLSSSPSPQVSSLLPRHLPRRPPPPPSSSSSSSTSCLASLEVSLMLTKTRSPFILFASFLIHSVVQRSLDRVQTLSR